MKKFSVLLYGLLFILWAAGTVHATLINGDFEAGVLDPWFQDRDSSPGGEAWNVTNIDAHTGIWSATNDGNKELRQDITPILADDILEISFWVVVISFCSSRNVC